jgi:hypothetical protein
VQPIRKHRHNAGRGVLAKHATIIGWLG